MTLTSSSPPPVRPIGPLDRHDLEMILDRGHDAPARRALLASLDLTPEASLDEVEGAFEAEERAMRQLAQLDEEEQPLLELLVMLGGRARGENVRKELLLMSRGDATEAMRRLIERHLLIILPPSSHSELDMNRLLSQSTFLQHELTLGAALYRELEGRRVQGGELPGWEGEVHEVRAESQQQLELNLLHLLSFLERDTLRLNKSGAPNRRAASRVIGGLTRPASAHLPEPWLTLDVGGQDYFAFLLAMGEQLRLTCVRHEQIVGDFEAAHAFFEAPRHVRRHALLDAVQKVRGWSEWVSAHLAGSNASDDIIERQLSQHVDNGAALIGARGYLISVIRRARIEGWVALDSVVELCTQLDRDYLPRVVERLTSRAPTAEEVVGYVRAFLEHALFWTGLVELARGEGGERLLTLSEAGKEVFAMGQEQGRAPTPEPMMQRGSLIVQPNYEIMVFLDAVTTPTLFFLYRVAERVAMANRVATFRLSAASVQRGYSLGLDAQALIDTLFACSVAPLASSVEFQIRDWERIWGRLVLWARGLLLRHDDPDILDDVVSELRYALRHDPPHIERLGPSSLYIHGVASEPLLKALSRHTSVRIDYLGERPPCLEVAGALRFAYDPLSVDIITLSELRRISEDLPQGAAPRRRVVELEPALIRRRWPEDPLASCLKLLEQVVRGGLPPEQILRLRAALDLLDELTVHRDVVVLELPEPLADLLMRSDIALPMIVARHGPTALAVEAHLVEELLNWLEEIGVIVHEPRRGAKKA